MSIYQDLLGQIPNVPGIYCITNTTNYKRYIGSSCKPYHCLRTHIWELQSRRHYNTHLQRAWTTYGSGAFAFEMLEFIETDDRLALRQAEAKWIREYQSCDRHYGYNLDRHPLASSGKVSDETRARMSAAALGKVKSEQHRERLRLALKGRINTPEQIDRHRQAARRHQLVSPGDRFCLLQVISEGPGRPSGQRTWLCQCVCGGQKLCTTGRLRSGKIKSCGCYGPVAARAGKYTVMDPDGQQKSITNLSAFCRENNLSYQVMLRVASGRAKLHRGWKCSRRED